MFFKNKQVFITGGAGFIGHHLLNKLIHLGATVTVGDNLSIGRIDNIFAAWKANKLKYKKTDWGYRAENGHRFILVDFQNLNETIKVIKDSEIIFYCTHYKKDPQRVFFVYLYN